MPIEQNPATGRWWDTDQPEDVRDQYDSKADAEAAKQAREAALALIPIEVWAQIGEYVGRSRAVGGGRYAQDARDLASLSQVDKIRRAEFEPTLGTTRLIDTTALRSKEKQHRAELEEKLSEWGKLEVARQFAAQPGKRPKLPEGVTAKSELAKALYEYRGIEQRIRLDRESAQKESFLLQSVELGINVVALLRTRRLLNPEFLPAHLTATAKELASEGQLGRLAEYLTVEEDILAGRTVVAGAEPPAAWRQYGAAADQLPPGAKQVGGDRTSFTVTPEGGLRDVVTTQQKLVRHRFDVSSNITDAVNQLFGRSKPPEVPLLGSSWQLHIILPYSQVELPTVSDDIDGYRNWLQREAARTPSGGADVDAADGDLEQARAALEKAIMSAEANPVDLDAWCRDTLAGAASRKDFQVASGSPTGLVLIIDTLAGRYRATYRGDGSEPRIDREPAPEYLRRLVAIIAGTAAWDAAVAAERVHQISKLDRKRRGAIT
jgi:hypothetical protein